MSLLNIVLLVFTVTASASEKYYKCFDVGGVPEYVIEINLKTKKAAFFNNDSWLVLPLTSVRNLESLPPQLNYTFGSSPIYIRFNQTKLIGAIVEESADGTLHGLEAQAGCQAVNANSLVKVK